MIKDLSDGRERYKVFHMERFVENSKKLSEVIHKVKLPPLTDKFIITNITCEKPKQKEKYCPKKITALQRKIDTAKGKADEFWDILKHNMTENNMFYDGDVVAKTQEVKN